MEACGQRVSRDDAGRVRDADEQVSLMGRKERRAEIVVLFPIRRNANRMTQHAVPGRHAGGRGRRHWLGVILSAMAAAEGGEGGGGGEGDSNSNAHSGREREAGGRNQVGGQAAVPWV